MPPNGPGARLQTTAPDHQRPGRSARRKDGTTPRLDGAVGCQLQRLVRQRAPPARTALPRQPQALAHWIDAPTP